MAQEPRPEDLSTTGEYDLSSPDLFLNRELTWLQFNDRVLREAEDPRTPLLERAKFLAIVGSTLDEFFMKRVGGLKQQVGAGMHERSVDGRTAAEQIAEVAQHVLASQIRQQALFGTLVEELREAGIRLARYDELSDDEQKQLRAQYADEVFPLLTPQGMDPAHPFPFVSNLSLNLLVALELPTEEVPGLARVKVPVGAGVARFMRLGDSDTYVPLEDVMGHNLDFLFPDIPVLGCSAFRVTRNSNTEGDEDQADDLLALIQSELRERRFAPIVRLQVEQSMDPRHRGMLAAELGLDEAIDVYDTPGMFGLADLFEIASIQRPDLKYAPHYPVDHPELTSDKSIFHVIRERGSVLLQHPYESFATSVERFLAEAARDPKVRAIKMTIYRTAAQSRVAEHLIEAARNGKQVAVVVELKARFDEQANIRWANQLEQFGIHVTYGVVGLKTHCKVILVIRKDYDGISRYVHVGTGNYHAETARQYTDFGILTTDERIAADATELFNYLTTGYKPNRDYKELLVAPRQLKRALLDMIKAEREAAKAGEPSGITIKANALEDTQITRALYKAARAGVPIDLIIRDSCRLRPGLPGLSESIRVMGIVGRFLEHSRIYRFENRGEPRFFIGSADVMKRNLESRVEVLVPVKRPEHHTLLQSYLQRQLSDQRSAWDMQSDGSYVQRKPKKADAPGCQDLAIDAARKRAKEAVKKASSPRAARRRRN